MRNVAKTTRTHPLPSMKETADGGINSDITSLVTLDLKRILNIRRKTGSHFISVLASILGGIVRKIHTKNKNKETDLPEFMQEIISLPWPNHPRKKLCNHWYSG